MLNQLRSQRLLEKRHCLLWLLDEMRLLCWLLRRLFELLRSFWLRRWCAIVEDGLLMERWPCRFLRGSVRGVVPDRRWFRIQDVCEQW